MLASKQRSDTSSSSEPIAIVGSSCRFPGGASSPSKLWQLLSQPRDVLRPIPTDRFNPKAFYHPNGQRAGTTNVQHAYTLEEDFRHFDASFFSVKPIEADSMDPQQRLLLETVYESLESAGIPMADLQGSDTAVYVGLMCMDYGDTGIRDLDSLPTYFATGASRCIISNRISYFFDWHGPSMTVDTACSSSLVAMHQAVQVLRSGQSRVALAAGANLILGPEAFISESNLKMLSPEGRSRMWDSKANGYGRGEGVAAVVLKTLRSALEDGDHIECIIRETGVNSDGRTKGITTPSSFAQRDLIRDTYARAGLDIRNPADRPQYFEAHGTGTPAGDPIEARAIHDAFFTHDDFSSVSQNDTLFVGSIKTVVGHTEGTAGLAGVLKASLALKQGVIPPNMLFSNLNPEIKPFYRNLQISSSARPWPELPPDCVRRASVNSFGFGGTNAHVILETYENPSPALGISLRDHTIYSPFVFSAATEESLVTTLRNYATYLRAHPSTNLRDLVYTLQSRRSNLPVKVHICAHSVHELAENIEELIRDSAGQEIGIRQSPDPQVDSGILGIFTGQGAQWATMGRELILGCDMARSRIRDLEESLARLSQSVRPTWSITGELLKEARESRIAEACLSQPLCTAVQIVLVDLLREAGIIFKSVIGHSSGEIAAAYAAGFITAEDAVRVAYFRGITAPLASGAGGERGGMMAVGTSEEDAAELCDLPLFEDRISIAAVNSSSSVTLSGDVDAIAEAQKVFAEEKKFNRILKVDTAYHSHHMQKSSSRYLELMVENGVQVMDPKDSKTTWYSSVYDGAPMGSTEDLKGEYWVNNMLKTVKFHHALSAALSNGGAHHVAVEIGPHPALKGPSQQTIADYTSDPILYVGTLDRRKNDVHAISDSLAQIWEAYGSSTVNLSAVEATLSNGTPARLIKGLPSYAWNHNRVYWFEGRASREFRTRDEPFHELLGTRSPDGTKNHVTWHNVLRMEDIPWLAGHELQGQVIFPASGYIGMAIDAAVLVVKDPDAKLVKVEDIEVGRPITFDSSGSGREVRFHLSLLDSASQSITFSWSVYSNSSPDSSSMALNASGRVRVLLGNSSAASLPDPEAEGDPLIPCSSEQFYKALHKMGYGYNGAFQGIKDVKRRLGKASGIADASTEDNRHSTTLKLHPAVLDLAFQASFLAYAAPGDGRLWSLHVPTSIRSVSVDLATLSSPHGNALTEFRFMAAVSDPYSSVIDGNVDMYDLTGTRTLLQVQGLRAVPISAAVARDDCKMFADLHWDIADPDGQLVVAATSVSNLITKTAVVEQADSATTDFAVAAESLSAMVKQVSHRYSRMRILELGADSCTVTKRILEQLGDAFASYTFTSASAEVLGQVAADLQRPSDISTIISKELDVERDLVEQGFAPGSYDLVISVKSLTNARSSDNLLRGIRSLLKPGAYTMFLERSGSLSDPTLKLHGLSGVETTASKPGHAFEVIVSQALTPEVELYRKPLDVDQFPSKIERLIVVGGQTPTIRTLTRGIKAMLAGYAKSLEVFETLDRVSNVGGAIHATVLLLSDLDEPIFKNCSADKLEGLKQVIFGARDIVWVTRGCRSSDPYANITSGFGRTIAMESSHLRLHLVDVDFNMKPDAVEITEILLRWHIAGLWEKTSTNANLMLSIEPEIAIEKGHVFVPRVYPNKERNDRYNSSRRKIIAKVDSTAHQVQVKQNGESDYSLEVRPRFTRHAQVTDDTSALTLTVSMSTLSALRTANGAALYLLVGQSVTNGKDYLAFSESLSSLTTVPKTSAIEVNDLVSEDILAAVAAGITAETIIGLVPQGSQLVIHDAGVNLIPAIKDLASVKNARCMFTSSTSAAACEVITIYPQSAISKVKTLLPRGRVILVDLAETEAGRETARLLKSAASAFLVIEAGATLLFREAFSGGSHEHGNAILRRAWERALRDNARTGSIKALQVGDVSDAQTTKALSSIIGWKTSQKVAAFVAPVDETALFAPDKTYLLFGLTGGLGLSLCEWMVHKGAKYLVITSRSPKTDPEWLSKLEATGATIKIMANDITDKESVLALHDTITKTMPPIAGVANGAMVLSDTTLYEMDAEGLNKVLKPKVDGTVILDQVYRDASLDFFILFSSITCVFGNSGQGSYTAANMFMTSLAAQRRANGLVASVMDIGAMIGTGYMDRELSQSRRDELLSLGYLGMSERDFHQTFAEAIVAGLPENAQSPELIAGLRCVTSNEASLTHWYDNPKYQHCITWINGGNTDESQSKTNASARKRLLESTSVDETRDIVTDAFASRLQAMLQIRSDSVNDRSLMLRSGLAELGVDSLVAVDIRSWFLKELDVDIPILQILGGLSVEALVYLACEKLSPELTAHVVSSEPAIDDSEIPTTPSYVPDSPSPGLSESSSDLAFLKSDTDLTSSSISTTSEITTDDDECEIEDTVQPSMIRTAPLSLNQSRFWFLRSYIEDQTTFNVTCRIRVEGALKVKNLQMAVAALGQRHEALRTCFFTGLDGNAYQTVLEKPVLQLETKKLSSEEDSAKEHQALAKHVYDLERGEIMRIILLEVTPDVHYMLIGYHHINMDGVSFQVLLSDLESFYKFQHPTQEVLQYPDLAYRQRYAIGTGAYDTDMVFWREELRTLPDPLPLFPFAKYATRSQLKSYASSKFDLRLEPALASRVKKIGSTVGNASSFHFYLTVLRVLLAKFLSVDDFCIGIADANRIDKDTMAAIGMYLNLLPLRFSKHAPNQTFADAVAESRAKAFAALAHSKVPFDVVLEKLAVPRSASHSPLFQAFVDFRQGQQETRTFGNCKMKGDMFELGETAYDISVDIIENQNSDTLITFALQRQLYSAESAEIVAKSYLHLIQQFCDDPSLLIGESELFAPADISKAIEIGRGLTLDKEWPATMAHRIDEAAAQFPERVALEDGYQRTFTYTEMCDKVQDLTNALIQAGVKPSDRVAMYQQPSTDWVCTMLAVFRVGATHVPLDMRAPAEQHRAILRGVRPAAIVLHKETLEDSSLLGFADVPRVNASAAPKATTRYPVAANAKDDAVILHTSGSTGEPKGIVLTHEGLCNTLEFSSRGWDIGTEAVLQQTAFSFDACLEQVSIALCNGGRLYILSRSQRMDSADVVEQIHKRGITYTMATPSEYRSWMTNGDEGLMRNSAWRIAYAVGEVITPGFMRSFRALAKSDLRLYNGYGPAECCILSAKHHLPYTDEEETSLWENSAVPCGRILPNFSAYIMDERMRPLPLGVPGELFIGGASVGRGYLDLAEMTANKFLTDPYASERAIEKGWTRMHRTGDKAKLLPDGTVIVLGRIDSSTQVKVRGIRIDLRNVENTIIRESNGGLHDVIVSYNADKDLLVAYAVFSRTFSDTNRPQFLETLRTALPLPRYMIPTIIVPLDGFPMNAHGKADRRAIGALQLNGSTLNSGSGGQAVSDLEASLWDLWKEVLPGELVNNVAVNSEMDFFQLGGNSLLLVALRNRIRSSFDSVFQLDKLMESTTLGSMAALIQKTSTDTVIDWAKETALPKNLKRKSPRRSPTPTKKTILLTGSTGFIGRQMLKQLAADPTVGTIHAVAVRNPPEHDDAAAAAHPDPDKIRYHPGDLSKPSLGLDEALFHELADSADAIVHAGAWRSFWENYQLLRRTNVGSTSELVRMAAVRNVPLHFMSSGAVPGLGAAPPATDGSGGYVASKWAAERLLEKAAAELGIPVVIHRPGPSGGAAVDEPEVLKGFAEMAGEVKSVPDIGGWEGTFDLVRVEDLVAEILGAVLGPDDPRGSARVVRYEGVHRVDARAVAEYVVGNNVVGEGWTTQPAIYWIGKIKKHGFPYVISAQDLTLTDGSAKDGTKLTLKW